MKPLRALLLAAALGLAACNSGRVELAVEPRTAIPVGLTGPAEGQRAMTDLYRQALAADERTVVVYSSTGPLEWEPLWRAFADTFPGMTVTYSHITPSQVMNRINAESVTGRRFGDVFITPVNVAEEVADAGYFIPYTPPTLAGIAPRYRDPDGLVHYPFAKAFGLAYDPRVVTPDLLPREFDDVLDPRWRGRFSYIKPATVNGTTDVAIANLELDGAVTRAELAALRDNGAFSNIEAGVTYVSQGRQAMQLWAYLPTVMRQQSLGAPLRFAFVPDFSTLVPFGTAISRNVVHPNAARLFAAWIFTPQAQAVLAREVHMYATMPGAPPPAYFPGEAALHDRLGPKQLQVVLAEQKPALRTLFNKPVAR
jgi:iron(III) transport system substrate-binding protein